ncbi:MAG: acetyl-CoA acetyltransferase [Gammaproteobacteria bacterium]|jgi:acetyl-CoA C-acetyltransferase|nr:acetyl-CoA acetyltransferase [Gammaproteobacteria bacterium]
MSTTKPAHAYQPRKVYIVDGARTPFLKARGKPGEFSASDLAVSAGKTLLLRQPFSPSDIDEVIMGCVMPSENEANIARIISLRLGCGRTVPAWTVQRNCGSGMQAIDCAVQDIATGRHNLVLAGGTEAMSQAPLLWRPDLVRWLADVRMSKGFAQKLTSIVSFRPQFLKPIIALIRGLSDPVVGLNMGETAENLAYKFNITREQMDAFSIRSHHRLARAQENGALKEVTPVYSVAGKAFEKDDGVRPGSSMAALAKLQPYFDKRFGSVTAGNSSQVTDGAAMLLLASEEAIEYYKLPVLGTVVDSCWRALAPGEMGLGPVHATTPLLTRNNLNLSDIDYWEINEAFAAQVLACIAAWEDKDYCHHYLGLDKAMGSLDQERLNVDGGAIALGHPVGSSGARIVLHLLDVLRRNRAKRGIAALCIGGGQGGAILIEV